MSRFFNENIVYFYLTLTEIYIYIRIMYVRRATISLKTDKKRHIYSGLIFIHILYIYTDINTCNAQFYN